MLKFSLRFHWQFVLTFVVLFLVLYAWILNAYAIRFYNRKAVNKLLLLLLLLLLTTAHRGRADAPIDPVRSVLDVLRDSKSATRWRHREWRRWRQRRILWPRTARCCTVQSPAPPPQPQPQADRGNQWTSTSETSTTRNRW